MAHRTNVAHAINAYGPERAHRPELAYSPDRQGGDVPAYSPAHSPARRRRDYLSRGDQRKRVELRGHLSIPAPSTAPAIAPREGAGITLSSRTSISARTSVGAGIAVNKRTTLSSRTGISAGITASDGIAHRFPTKPAPRRHSDERGFALLLVFALAASIALLIYLEIPRVAFEHQRDKEQLLIDRGEQYVRAIELYQRKYPGKNPQTLDDLEPSTGGRFLRRRYKDPMTGSDEWRLIHVDGAGQYTDSKIHKKKNPLDQQDTGPSVLAAAVQGIGSNAVYTDQSAQQVSAGMQRRASDRISPGGANSGTAGDPSNPDPNANPSEPNAPAATNGSATPPATPPNNAPANNLFGTSQGQQQTQGQGNANQQQNSGTSLAGPPAFGSATPATPIGLGGSAASGSSNAGQQNQNNGSTPSPGMQAVQQLLGQQSNSSNSSSTGSGTGNGTGVTGGGAGIVGVATKLEQEGIRRYKDHSNYSEWEFLYEPKSAQNNGQQGNANQQGGQPAGTASTNTNSNSSFGGMSGGTPAPAGPPNN